MSYRDYLASTDLQSFPLTRLDRVGVPVWSATCEPGEVLHGAGYGWEDHVAERSALGELAESLAALRWSRRTRPRRLALGDALRAGAVDPRTLSLPLGAELDDDRDVLWVEADDGRLVPLEAVATNPGEFATAAGAHDDVPPLFVPITNGLGAGDAGRARNHGLNELLQRHLNWSQFKALDSGRAVDADAVDPDLARRCRDAGLELVVKYSGHAFGVHAFHCAARDEDPRTPAIVRTATGEGADADPVVAARKAMLECCSSRVRKWFSFGGRTALAVAPVAYVERFADAEPKPFLEDGADLSERFAGLLADPAAVERVVRRITQVHETVPLPPAFAPEDRDRLLDDVLVVTLTEPDDPVTVVKAIVPGLEAEVLSHHRVGAPAIEQLRARAPWAVFDGAADPGAGWARSATGAWVDERWLDEVARDFLPLYREPGRHDFAFAA